MKTLNILEYGTEKNITVGVIEALKTAKSINDDVTIFFPKNEYHFYKDYSLQRKFHTSNTDTFVNANKHIAFLIENTSNVTIDGGGSTFVIHGDIMAICTAFSKNITLKNFIINYNSPTDVEMRVKSIDKKRVVYEIPQNNLWYINKNEAIFFEQSPFTKKNYWEFANRGSGWCIVLHRESEVKRLLNSQSPFKLYSSMKRLNETELEISYKIKPKYNVGDTIVLSQNKIRNTCGCFNYECENTVVQNVDVNYLQGFGWLNQMCNNASFNNVRFISSNDRKTTSFADCIHVSGAKGKIDINNCYFSDSHDDGINIHGTFMRVKEKLSDKKIKLEYVHNQQGGFSQYHIGDKVKFYYRDTLLPDGENYIVNSVINPLNNGLSGKETIVEFDRELPSDIDAKIGKEMKVVAENATYCPDVEINNCIFENIPTRGILCTTRGKVSIKGNLFKNCLMANIFVSNDSNEWYESGPVRNMKIVSNKFYISKNNKSASAILFEPVVKGNKCKNIVHKNIVIENNEFNVPSGAGIIANNVENISIKNNVFNCGKKNKFKYCKNVLE